jgi:hypothetical protein
MYNSTAVNKTLYNWQDHTQSKPANGKIVVSLLQYGATLFKTSYPKILILRTYLYENSLAQNELTQKYFLMLSYFHWVNWKKRDMMNNNSVKCKQITRTVVLLFQ